MARFNFIVSPKLLKSATSFTLMIYPFTMLSMVETLRVAFSALWTMHPINHCKSFCQMHNQRNRLNKRHCIRYFHIRGCEIIICPNCSDPFHIVTYYMKWVTTSGTYSNVNVYIIFNMLYSRGQTYCFLTLKNEEYFLLLFFYYHHKIH